MFAVVGIGFLRFDADINRLGSADLQSGKLQERLADQMGISTAPLLLTFNSFDGARQFQGSLSKNAEAASQVGRVELWPAENGAIAVVHPKGNPFDQATFAKLIDSLSAVARESGLRPSQVTGAAVVNARLTELLRGDLPRTLLVAFACVLLVLILGTGGIGGTLLALIPLVCGFLWMGGLMGFAHMPLSVMSVAIAPLILGVGVDDSVHMLMAWRRAGGQLKRMYRETGVAVVATTVTTVAAFASLIPSATAGLGQFGWQASVGLAACMVASLIVLPATFLAFGLAGSACHGPQDAITKD